MCGIGWRRLSKEGNEISPHRIANRMNDGLLKSAVLTLTVLSAACSAPVLTTLRRLPLAPCETATGGVEWYGPVTPQERLRLSAWCQSVGPVVVNQPPVIETRPDIASVGLIVATWNIHEGGGDLLQFLTTMRDTFGATIEIVVLIQEAVRRGDAVPATIPPTISPPRRIRPHGTLPPDIVAVARLAGMRVAYIPSMRNGAAVKDGEDRGCAILSTLPLSDTAGIELPWIRQRRVAVMATVHAWRGSERWRMKVVSVHLDNRRGRSQQAAALARLLRNLRSPQMPMVVGGDLNTWWGLRKRTVRELDAVIPRAKECGDGPTFRFHRHLDYLFTDVPEAARVDCEIADSTYGSDHHPTILRMKP
jgi:endonuclease/exonuclease/phosphatase family metal-dependent hydrolase